ncbi:MAG: tail protein X [Desulfovibrionaceae bacterium]|nr:tail protein X [Desulfovibrionaceae bacterium]
MTSHIRTVQGQAWDQIAKSVYGSELLLDRLVSGNPEEADVLLFSGDTPLSVPVISGQDIHRTTTALPPWERPES